MRSDDKQQAKTPDCGQPAYRLMTPSVRQQMVVWAMERVGDREDAEDLVHDVIAKLFERKVLVEKSLEGLLRTMVNREAANLYRRRGSVKRGARFKTVSFEGLEQELVSPHGISIKEESSLHAPERIELFVDALTEGETDILLMALNGLRQCDIAKALGVSRARVCQAMKAIKAKFLAIIQTPEPPPPRNSKKAPYWSSKKTTLLKRLRNLATQLPANEQSSHSFNTREAFILLDTLLDQPPLQVPPAQARPNTIRSDMPFFWTTRGSAHALWLRAFRSVCHKLRPSRTTSDHGSLEHTMTPQQNAEASTTPSAHKSGFDLPSRHEGKTLKKTDANVELCDGNREANEPQLQRLAANLFSLPAFQELQEDFVGTPIVNTKPLGPN